MKSLEERQAERLERKRENQGQEAIDRDNEAGMGRAGIGTTDGSGRSAESAGGNGGGAGGWPGSGGDEGGSGQGGEADHFATVDSLSAHAETVTDPAELDALIAAEQGGKNRAGALSALQARKTALAAS